MARKRTPVEGVPTGRVAPSVGVPAAGIAEGEDPADKPIDQPERGPATPVAAEPVRVRVDVDTLIERPDLASHNISDEYEATPTTLVLAGELIPVGLEGYPRSPA